MSSSFIPSFHFVDPEKKLTSDWGMEVIQYHWYSSNKANLLFGKDLKTIEEFSSGYIDMDRFKKMFTSIRKSMGMDKNLPDGTMNQKMKKVADDTGLSWEPLALIPQKLNSAVSTVQKIPMEVQCVAQDGFAMKKRSEDITFLKNKPVIENDLQDFADQMQIGKVDIGTTKHSDKKYSSAPMGLDLLDPDEEEIFAQLIYSLNVEKSNEKALQQFYYLKKANQVKLLEIVDNFKYGVCANRAFPSEMTGLPDLEYIFPGDMEMPISKLKDYSDVPVRFYNKEMTVLEMYNYFKSDICSEEDLYQIINGKGDGYCACNKRPVVGEKSFGSFKLTMKFVEVKSLDWIGVTSNPKSKRGVRTFTTDPEKCESRIWGQNTYGFWWLLNTKKCFGIHKLPGSYRTKGQESFQGFSTNVYKSQQKSAVELSVGENIKAQIADIKLEYAILMSLPAGKVVDLKQLRGSLEGLKKENASWTQQDLLNLAFERNIMIIDTEGFDDKPGAAQMKPFIEIPGGLKTEIAGYMQIILAADRNISNFTGINEQLTGQSPNPDMLVGLQKLLINSGLNAIYYCNEAIQSNYTSVFNLWANYIQGAIEKGGKTKQAIIDMIGINDVNLLDGLDETPLHNLTIKVLVGQREVERDMFNRELDRMKKLGAMGAGDEYILSGIDNPKERFAYLAVKEKRFNKKQDQIRQENYQNQQQIVAQQGTNMVQAKSAEGQSNIKEIYAKGDVQAKILQLANQLGLSSSQTEGLIKMALQRDRNVAQKDKAISTIREKHNAEAQAAL